MSLIESIELVEGDSSDIYTFSSSDFPDLSDANWQSTLSVRERNITGVEVLNRSLTKSGDNTQFIFQLSPTETDNLGAGRFFVTISLFNLSLGFRREVVQCQLGIEESGLL